MRFSTVIALSMAASASSALAYAYNTSDHSVWLTSRVSIATLPHLVRTMQFHVAISRTLWISSPATTRRGKGKHTSKSVEAATKGQALAKKLPNEIKAEIGKQGLDGSKPAADRGKVLGTTRKDVQKAYHAKLNQEVKGGQVPGGSWGLQATLDENRHLRRALDAE